MDHYHPVPGPASGSGPSPNSGFHIPNFPFGDTTFTKLFVGGLAWETQDESLRRHFERYGDILEAVVITDKSTGRSKGYGFVTFTDPESARRACEDPNPVIDGRRANCNLASLGRPLASPPYARPRTRGPYFAGVPVPRGAFVGSSGYYQPVLYDYQQGFTYPPYGYMMYGTEFVNPQNVYGTSGTQFVQARRVPGAMNPSMYPFRQFGQSLPNGYEYPIFPGYEMPSHQFLQFRGTNLNGATAGPIPAIQTPYSPAQISARPQSITSPARPPRFTRDGTSDQMAG